MSSVVAQCRYLAAAGAAVVAALGAGCGGGESDTVDPGSANPDSAVSLEEAQAPVKGAPPELVDIREEANEILDGGLDDFNARLAGLEEAGVPVVINKWASWCAPCREEFPDFQTQAIERGDEIAFLGLLSNDGPDTGETFLTGLPLPYPSYLDSDQDIAGDLGISREFPTTVIIGSDGEIAYTKYGQYPDEEALAADIQEYAN